MKIQMVIREVMKKTMSLVSRHWMQQGHLELCTKNARWKMQIFPSLLCQKMRGNLASCGEAVAAAADAEGEMLDAGAAGVEIADVAQSQQC